MMKNKHLFLLTMRACLTALMMLLAVVAYGQDITVKGSVKDANGDAIIGASVHIQGTKSGVITNLDGNYSLKCSPKATLEFSYIGFKSKVVAVANKTVINVVLEETATNLNEVVVTAMGIKKDEKKLGYAVSSIGTDDLLTTASPNLGSALYGKAAGVTIKTAPGGSTGAISINVRGLSSITGNNQPLIIVDGVPIHNGEANNTDYWGDQRVNSNGLADINTEDIANLSILKGAAASALYGSEAANGVVMITTKTGKGNQGIGVDFNASWTVDKVAYMPEYQTIFGPGVRTNTRLSNGCDEDGWYQRKDRNGVSRNSVMNTTAQYGPRYDSSKQVLYYDGTMRPYEARTSNPWADVFRTGFSQQYNVAITKGNDNGNIRFSYTYFNDNPTQYNSRTEKHNFSLTGSQKIIDNIKIDYSINYMVQNVKNRPYRIARLVTNFGGMFSSFDDINWIRNHTMTAAGYRNRTYTSTNIDNPAEGFEYDLYCGSLVDEYYWNILGKTQTEKNNRLIASVTPSWEIIPGLTLRLRLATDYTGNKIENKNRTETANSFGSYSGSYGLANNRYEIYYGDAMLNYTKKLTEKIDLDASVGYSARRESSYNLNSWTNGGLTVENWFNLNASANTPTTGMSELELLKTAVFGTASISYDNWAYLEGTIRSEKTSTLAPGNNTYTYPSINGSIIISELLKDAKPTWLDYGKVRVSYGVVGNAPEIYKAAKSFTQKTISGYVYNMQDVAVGNDGIKPETTYEWEFGLEGKFLHNRAGFELSYYTAKVKDQILSTTMPNSSGGTSILMNIGELNNKGIEFSAYGTPVLTKDWRWDVRGNLAWNHNEVTKLADGVDILQHKKWDNGAAYLYSAIGQKMGDIYAYAPKEDANGNKIVGSDGFYEMTDKPVKVGNAMPKVTGGFSTSVTYKDFFLDASLDFRIGGAVFNMPYEYMMGRGSLKASLAGRDKDHGGLSYYFDGDNECVATTASAGPSGQKVYDNGMILNGVTEDGKANTKMITSDIFYNWTYNWGTDAPTYYSHSIFNNTYVKVRELSIGYSFPKSIISKFHCKKLQLSVYGRNLFYIYKRLPEFDAEATDGTNWMEQTWIGGSTATTRSYGVSLRASF